MRRLSGYGELPGCVTLLHTQTTIFERIWRALFLGARPAPAAGGADCYEDDTSVAGLNVLDLAEGPCSEASAAGEVPGGPDAAAGVRETQQLDAQRGRPSGAPYEETEVDCVFIQTDERDFELEAPELQQEDLDWFAPSLCRGCNPYVLNDTVVARGDKDRDLELLAAEQQREDRDIIYKDDVLETIWYVSEAIVPAAVEDTADERAALRQGSPEAKDEQVDFVFDDRDLELEETQQAGLDRVAPTLCSGGNPGVLNDTVVARGDRRLDKLLAPMQADRVPTEGHAALCELVSILSEARGCL